MKRKFSLGRHRRRYILCRQVLAVKDGSGEKVPSWPQPSAGTDEFWASLDTLTAGETIAAGVRQTTEALRVRVCRGFPGKATDRMRNKATGALYSITGIAFEDAETVLSLEVIANEV